MTKPERFSWRKARPLPQERETISSIIWRPLIGDSFERSQTILPLLGERAGVRAGFYSHCIVTASAEFPMVLEELSCRRGSVFSPSFSFCGVSGLDLPLFYFLSILQFTTDGFVAAGNHFLALLDALDNFPTGIIADPNLNWQHPDVVPLEHKYDFYRFGSFFF